MSYLAEEQIWYDGPDSPPTSFFGFFLTHGDWNMPIITFASVEDRDYAVDTALLWGLSYMDAVRTGALVSAYGESSNESYLEAAIEIAGSGNQFMEDEFTTYVDHINDLIWE